MAKQKEKKPLDKKGWVQTFELIGKACIKDYTFKIDEHSIRKSWLRINGWLWSWQKQCYLCSWQR